MKQLVAIVALFFMTTLWAQEVQLEENYYLKQDIKFLSTDHRGVLNLFDHFMDSEIIPRNTFVRVKEVHSPRVQTQTVQGKTISSCSRSIKLEIENCHLNQSLYLEQIIEYGSPSTRLNLIAKNGQCHISYYEEMNAFCHDQKILKTKSKFKSFFEKE